MWQNEFLQVEESTSKMSAPEHYPFKESTKSCTQKNQNYQTNTSIETVDRWKEISKTKYILLKIC